MGVFDERNFGKLIISMIIFVLLLSFGFGTCDTQQTMCFDIQKHIQNHSIRIIYLWIGFIIINGLLVGPFIDGFADKETRRINYTSKLFEMGVYFPFTVIVLLQFSVAYIARQLSSLLINQA